MTPEHKAAMRAAKAAIRAQPKGKHIVRAADGKYIALPVNRKVLMEAMCMECLGWEDDPKDCTSPLCPLYPFRRRTYRTQHGTLDSPTITGHDHATRSNGQRDIMTFGVKKPSQCLNRVSVRGGAVNKEGGAQE